MSGEKHIILLLEDDYATLKNMGDFLERKNYEVIRCSRIDQAKERFEDDVNDADIPRRIDCIVTDLNMRDEWLEKHQSESANMTLSGWVWLYRFVYPLIPKMPTVIYSKFVDDLVERIINTTDFNEREAFKQGNIKCLSKGNSLDTGRMGLIKSIEEVLKGARREK